MPNMKDVPAHVSRGFKVYNTVGVNNDPFDIEWIDNFDVIT